MTEGDENSPPFLFSDVIYKMLENALDFGITEKQFWESTFAELDRLTQSKLRVQKAKLKEKATLDYSLACLIGNAIGCQFDNKAQFPSLYDAYPSLFDEEKIQEEKKKEELLAELSAIRFKQFAENYNKKFQNIGGENNNG